MLSHPQLLLLPPLVVVVLLLLLPLLCGSSTPTQDWEGEDEVPWSYLQHVHPQCPPPSPPVPQPHTREQAHPVVCVLLLDAQGAVLASLPAVEVAVSHRDQQHGLMFRREPLRPLHQGMLFPLGEQGVPGPRFYMRNTLQPLDILFWGKGGDASPPLPLLLHLRHLQPGDETRRGPDPSTQPPVVAVLEVAPLPPSMQPHHMVVCPSPRL